MASETNPTGPSPMTDTDAGKRLSDEEPISQEEIREWFGDEIPMEVVTFMFAPENANKTAGEMRAWTRKYVQTHPRITANRGSVSEDRCIAILDECAKKYAGQKVDPIIVRRVAITAIQQAVSECSGGGAEEMRAAILSVIPGGSICDPQQIADAIRALPLPPSPVKLDHRSDCQLYTVPTYGLCTCDFDQRMAERTSPVKESRDAALIDELRGWKAGEKASDDTVRMIWIMNKAADALEGKLT